MNKYCEGIDCGWCTQPEPCIYKIANKLGNKLEEIKEIAIQNSSCIRCTDYKRCADCEDCSYKEILDKINEVEE